MLVKLLLSLFFLIIAFFVWVSYQNPLDVQFHFFGETFETELSVLMITSFLIGAILVFIDKKGKKKP
jgi:uncharacterized integral membrane protein